MSGWDKVESNTSTTSQEVNKLDYTKFPEGTTVIRVVDSGPFDFWSHWLPKHKKGVICPGKGCPICEIIKADKAAKNNPQYSSSKRYAIHVLNRTTNKLEVLIQGPAFFNQLLNLHKEVGDLETYDVKVTRKGSDKTTTYMVLPQQPTSLSDEDKAKLNDKVDLSTMLKAPTPEQVQMIMEGKSNEEVYGNNSSVSFETNS